MATDVEQLERLAANAEAKAAAAREKIEQEREKELAKRLERERDHDQRTGAVAERESLVAASREAYDAALAALEQTPIVQAIARFRSSKAAEYAQGDEVKAAQTRLGQQTSSYEPERREIDFRDMVNDAIRRVASDLVTEAQEARATEREAYLSGESHAHDS